MPIPVMQVDAFTDEPFSGNPAAVCLLDNACDSDWMQAVAAEMNLSETAFVRPVAEGYELRWFTPVTEVDLCGHATLATAHALWEAGVVPLGQAVDFHTRSGILTAARNGDYIEVDLPSIPHELTTAPKGLIKALGVEPTLVATTRFDLLVEVESAATLRGLTPDFGKLQRIPHRGVIVTSRSDDRQYDFISRFFAPTAGIDEDPVTGSAHCVLGPFWGERLGKAELIAYQVSARGGVLRVRLAGDRVVLGGKAVTVFRGVLV